MLALLIREWTGCSSGTPAHKLERVSYWVALPIESMPSNSLTMAATSQVGITTRYVPVSLAVLACKLSAQWTTQAYKVHSRSTDINRPAYLLVRMWNAS